MPRRSWRLRIEDTLQAIKRIDSYVAAFDYAQFSLDQLTIDAVLRNLEIVGEAAKHVPEEIRLRYSEIPWRDMQATRNLLSHGYFLVDLGIVWKTIRDDLPAIRPLLEQILDENE